MFNYNEAYESSLEWFGGDDLAAGVFLSKYALKDSKGNYLEKTPDDMHRRMAKEFARIELKYPNPLKEEEIFSLFQEFDARFGRKVIGQLVPQGSPMSGIGNDNTYVSISNCFVIDSAEDSYGGILFADQEQAQIMKRRGGVGHDISKIRPTNIPVNNAAASSDGIEIFMDRFSNTTREVAQNGRRGALMLTISVHHPDVLKFITIKKDKKRVTGANVSVRVTDDFMRAVINEENYIQHWPVDPGLKREEYLVWNETPAKEIWNAMMLAAWESAEPGVLFWDTIINNSPADIYSHEGFNTISTNPCGEIVLSAYDSCRLLAINLSRFVQHPFSSKAQFDWESYKAAARKAQRLMDSMIDLEIEKIDKIIEKIQNDPERLEIKQIELNLWNKIKFAAERGRRTGTGITALGDVIAALNFTYGDQNSIRFTEEIYKQLAINCYIETIEIAKERGAFPVFDHSLESNHQFLSKIISTLPEQSQKDYAQFGRRNIALTTTAPTGTVSVLTQTSSGIEPVFSTHYKRRRKINPEMSNLSVDFVDELGDSWHEYYVFHHWFKLFLELNNLQHESPDDAFLKSPYYRATANDVDWEASVDIQAKAQNWICHSISKTCLSKDSLIETNQGLLYIDEIESKNSFGELKNENLQTINSNSCLANIGFINQMGEKQLFKIKTKSGLFIKATGDHKFLSIDQNNNEIWTELLDLIPGDYIKKT